MSPLIFTHCMHSIIILKKTWQTVTIFP